MGLGQGPEKKLKGVFMIVVDDSSREEWYRGHGVRKLGRVRERGDSDEVGGDEERTWVLRLLPFLQISWFGPLGSLQTTVSFSCKISVLLCSFLLHRFH